MTVLCVLYLTIMSKIKNKQMKLYHFILAGFLSLVFSSCNLTGRSESTPFFAFWPVLHIVDGDTTVLGFPEPHTLDTISVGDTILFRTFLFSEFNNLLSYRITSSRPSAVEFIWLPKDSLDIWFTSASDYDKGLFVMPGTYRNFVFPFQYVAKEATQELTLTFVVVNAGSRDYDTKVVTIRTPIKQSED